jgi:PAS domain S-box-containing protein
MGKDTEYFDVVFSVLNQGYLLVTANGEIVDGNQFAAEIFELNIRNLPGKKISELLTKGKTDQEITDLPIEGYINQTLQSKQPARSLMIKIYNQSSNLEKQIKINIAPLPDEKQSTLLFTLEDISEARKEESWVYQISKTLDQNPVSLVLTDSKEKVIYANSSFFNLTGLSHEEVLNHHFKSVCSLNTEKYNNIKIIIHSKDVWQGILRTEKKNKDVFWCQMTIAPILDDNDEIENFIISLIDVSGLKELHDEVENEKILLSTVINILPDAIFVKDKDLRKTLTNKADLEYIGLEEKDVIGKTDYEIFPEFIARSFALDDLQVLMNNKPSINKEETVVDIKGNQKILSTSKVPLKNKYGEIIGLVGIGHDITQQKKEAKELAINQHGIDHANIAIFRINESAEITYCNYFASKLLGYSKEELLKLTYFDIDRNFAKKDWTFQSSNQDEKHSSIFISEHQKKDGSRFPVEVTISYYNYNNVFFSYAFVSDITERERVKTELEKKNKVFASINEDFLKQNKELSKSLDYITQINTELEIALKRAEESDKLKSAFLANLSHEIRTPMNGILGFTELLKQQLLTDSPNIGYMDIIQNSGKRLVNVIGEIIDISKIHTGEIVANNSATDLTALINRLYQAYYMEAKHKGIELKFTGKNQILEIITDEEKLEAAFSKILDNAIKFTEEGEIEINCRKNKKNMTINFKDTGIGIEQDVDDKIFEIFRQGDYELSRRFEGTGIGLSIAKAYIELLGGNLTYKSKVSEGTTFIVKLPLLQENKNIPEVKQTILSKDNTEITGKKILAIDSETELMNYLQMTFNSFKAEFYITTDYIEAMNYIEKANGVDLILVNLNKESSERIQTIKDLRKDFAKMRLAALTKAKSVILRKAAISAGCNTIIPDDETRGVIVDMIIHAL